MYTVRENPDHRRSLFDYKWTKFEDCAQFQILDREHFDYLKATLQDVVKEIVSEYHTIVSSTQTDSRGYYTPLQSCLYLRQAGLRKQKYEQLDPGD